MVTTVKKVTSKQPSRLFKKLRNEAENGHLTKVMHHIGTGKITLEEGEKILDGSHYDNFFTRAFRLRRG